MKLHDLMAREQRLIELLEESGGEITGEIDALMKVMANEPDTVASKVDGYRRVLDTLAAGVAADMAMAMRFQKRKKLREQAFDQVKGRLLQLMVDHGYRRVEGTLGTVAVVPNSQPTFRWVGDDKDIPVACLKTIKEFSPSLAKSWVESGGIPPAGLVIDRGQHLRLE